MALDVPKVWRDFDEKQKKVEVPLEEFNGRDVHTFIKKYFEEGGFVDQAMPKIVMLAMGKRKDVREYMIGMAGRILIDFLNHFEALGPAKAARELRAKSDSEGT